MAKPVSTAEPAALLFTSCTILGIHGVILARGHANLLCIVPILTYVPKDKLLFTSCTYHVLQDFANLFA